MNIKIKGLSLEDMAEKIMALRLSDEKIFSYAICMDCEDYSIDDIGCVVNGLYVCHHNETREKIINTIKQSILIEIYDSYIDKWDIYDKVNEIFASLTSSELKELISKNLRVFQMYMVTEDFSDSKKSYYQQRTIGFNNLCMDYNHQLTQIPNSVRWYYLNNKDELTDILLLKEPCYLFLGNDFPDCRYYIDLTYDNDDQITELVLSDKFDTDKIKSLFENYIV